MQRLLLQYAVTLLSAFLTGKEKALLLANKQGKKPVERSKNKGF